MNLGKLLAIACLAFLTSRGWAADNLYWYEITVQAGNGTETFAGSAQIEPGNIASAFSGSGLITLDNLRIKGSENRLQWRTAREGQKLFLRPEKVLYFYLLTGDPAKN